MDNFSYYPKGIIMKDGKINEESARSQDNANSNTNSSNSSNFGNFGNLFANKNINDLLPLLLGKANLNKNEMLSQIMNSISKNDTNKDKPKEKIKKQNYIDEM